jgi:hypothetical protein
VFWLVTEQKATSVVPLLPLLPLLELPLLEPPLLEPPLLLLVPSHSLEQLALTHALMACDADVQLDSSAFEAHCSTRLALYVPLGQTQLRRSLQPLSIPLICELHLLCSHAPQADPPVPVRLSAHEPPLPPPPLPPPPLPLLLLEHAATAAKPHTSAAQTNRFVIFLVLRGERSRATRE